MFTLFYVLYTQYLKCDNYLSKKSIITDTIKIYVQYYISSLTHDLSTVLQCLMVARLS